MEEPKVEEPKVEEPKLYSLTVTERQARTLSRALNVWGRALGGQLHQVGHELHQWAMPPHPGVDASPEERTRYGLKWERMHLLSTLLLGLNTLVSGYDNGHAGHGIYSEAMPEEGKVAYDLDKAIRHCLWEANGREPGYSVDGDPPLLAGSEPLARVETAPPGTVLVGGKHLRPARSGNSGEGSGGEG